MENASSFTYFLLPTSASLGSETHVLSDSQNLSMRTKDAKDTIAVSAQSHMFSSARSTGDTSTITTASNSEVKENDDTVPLTSVPVVFTSEGQMTQILDMGLLGGHDSQMVTVRHAVDSSDTLCVTQSGDCPVLFQTSSSSAVDMLNSTMTESKSDMAMLQPVQGGTVVSHSHTLSKPEESGLNESHVLMPRVILSETESSKNMSRSSVDVHRTTTMEEGLPVVLSGNNLSLNISPEDKTPGDIYIKTVTQAEAGTVHSHGTSAGTTSIPVTIKTGTDTTTTLPLVLSGVGGSVEHESSDADKSVDSSALFQEGAVLVETPQGLMLSVGDELRAVTLTEGSDAQGNQLLSISNNCIPMALLSQCQQGRLMEEAGEGAMYDGRGEGETVVCSADLPLGTQQVLTVSTPEDEEPKKKNRGWPKGKKRKAEPEVHGPRAPMTGYVLYAINRRQEIKQGHPHLLFTEVTKILGQEWSTMPLEKKQKYLEEAENDKQRYIDELKDFQKSEMYRTLVKKKRLSDDSADVCDDLEDENDELYCKVCKLYFSSLHNKKEHILGRQHLQAITDQLKKELKKQEREQAAELRGASMVAMEMGSLGDNTSSPSSDTGDNAQSDQCTCHANKPVDVSSFILEFMRKNSEREQEIYTLKRMFRRNVQENWSICKQIQEMKAYESKLRQDLKNLAAHGAILTGRINTLKMVPALFGFVDF
ncbi:uncharacterized protein [Littorina saxatilis]|uniref:uncharacterized protein n=1 Tax=Littorina saxatilis TaxID=31220 RepID=UPI0038B4F5CA